MKICITGNTLCSGIFT